jgi:hypothetical protein
MKQWLTTVLIVTSCITALFSFGNIAIALSAFALALVALSAMNRNTKLKGYDGAWAGIIISLISISFSIQLPVMQWITWVPFCFITTTIVLRSVAFRNITKYKKIEKQTLEEKMRWEQAVEKQAELIKQEIMKTRQREHKSKIRDAAEQIFCGKARTRIPLNNFTKEAIFNKFDNRCVICNAAEGLHIHHKDQNPKNNFLANLMVLCNVCHKKIHMRVR